MPRPRALMNSPPRPCATPAPSPPRQSARHRDPASLPGCMPHRSAPSACARPFPFPQASHPSPCLFARPDISPPTTSRPITTSPMKLTSSGLPGTNAHPQPTGGTGRRTSLSSQSSISWPPTSPGPAPGRTRSSRGRSAPSSPPESATIRHPSPSRLTIRIPPKPAAPGALP